MTTEKIKELLNACYYAKRVRELLPPLPQGVTSSYIQYLDIIEKAEKNGVCVKVSDISDALEVPRPGVTRTVKEMEAAGYLKKVNSAEDRRITYLTVTESGKKLSDTYNSQFFSLLEPLLSDISDADAACAVCTIEKLYRAMSERRIILEY